MPKKPAGIGQNAQVLGDGITKLPIWYSIKGKGATDHLELGLYVHSAIVYSMIHPILNPNLVVYSDNLYTSHELMIRLKAQHVTYIGTVRVQYLPAVLKPLYSQFKKKRRDKTPSSCNSIPVIYLLIECYVYQGFLLFI